MKKNEIKEMRMNLGKFLHNYYLQFGEEKYDDFVKKMGEKMASQYGECFSVDNLLIMEAEYVTLNARLDEKSRTSTKKDTFKE